MADAGWYPDPYDPGAQRYFDGAAWTEHLRPTAPFTPPPPPPPPPQQPWSPPQQPYAAPPARRTRNRPLIIGLVAVVVAGLLTGGYFLFLRGDSAPELTYGGAKIKDASDVLKQAETNLDGIVKQRHGAENADTRCYYAVAKTPASGAKTDVDANLRCGPVLFVDGDANRPYLSFPLTKTGSGSTVTLSAAAQPQSPDPESAPADLKLQRPDGKDAPAGSAHLAVPKPPAATKDVVTAADLGGVAGPAQLDGAQMISLTTGVRLVAAGVVPRYGHGDDARSAPAGQQLIAFQTADEPGESGSRSAADKLTVLVTGSPARPLPESQAGDTYVVVAVPTGATASLQLTDSGYTQTLSLPAGTPGPKNLAVLARKHRTSTVGATKTIPVRFSNGAQSVSATFHATARLAELNFWVPSHESSHPSATDAAMLTVGLTYTDSLNPGSSYGFEPRLLKLTLPNGRVVSARNVATSADKVFNVFQVPATFTKGTIVISGSVHTGDVTLRVLTAAHIPVSFTAG